MCGVVCIEEEVELSSSSDVDITWNLALAAESELRAVEDGVLGHDPADAVASLA